MAEVLILSRLLLISTVLFYTSFGRVCRRRLLFAFLHDQRLPLATGTSANADDPRENTGKAGRGKRQSYQTYPAPNAANPRSGDLFEGARHAVEEIAQCELPGSTMRSNGVPENGSATVHGR